MMCNSFNAEATGPEAIRSLVNLGCQNIILHSNHSSDETLLNYAKEIPSLVLIYLLIPDIVHPCLWLDNIIDTFHSHLLTGNETIQPFQSVLIS